MIRLTLQNIAIVEDLELEFRPGFNVITGETGSGKSLILEAVQLVFGKRTSPKDLLRQGAIRGSMALGFDLTRIENRSSVQDILAEAGIDLLPEEEELVLGRDITASSSRYRANGCPVSAEIMERLGMRMLEIYGQHDLHTLFSHARQRELLDSMGGEPLLNLRREVRQAYRRFQELKIELESLRMQQENRERQLDFLAFQVQEIAQAEISDTVEDEQLKAERDRLSHSDKLRVAALQSGQILSDERGYDTPSIPGLLQQVQKLLNGGVSIGDPQFKQWYETVVAIQEDIRLLAHQLEHFAENLDSSPERMVEIVDRLDTLEKLKRKYGGTLETVLKTAAELEAELDSLQQTEMHFSHLQSELAQAEARYLELCNALSEMRQAHALTLEAAIQNELQLLMLPAARFGIALQPAPLSENGQEQIIFMFSANPGEPLKPLSQVGSGGELARLMLALKIQTAHADSITTLILDEIDTGMSGVTLRAISEKLQSLQQQCQIIVVTHQPMVAARAGWHLHVQKHVLEDSVTVTAVPLVRPEHRKAVLSQLASGFTHNDGATLQFIEQLLA